MREVQNDTKKEKQHTWKDTAITVGLTIVAFSYVRSCAPGWSRFKAGFMAAYARSEAKAKAKAAGAGASHQKNYPGGFENTMTIKEAALILGTGESGAESKVKEAHRRAIVKNHPDAGGSAYLASKINQAKDVLMKKIENN